MDSFKVTLPNNATLTGLVNKADGSQPNRPTKYPLVVCLHGGTYTARYFHVDATYSASVQSNSLALPLVAINRPGYGDSTSFFPIPKGSSYMEEYGIWLHRYILPTLWEEFGKPRNCNSIVLLCHSLGTPGAIVAAGMHAREGAEASYPLAGMIASGFGCQTTHSTSNSVATPTEETPDSVVMPIAFKDNMMLPEGHCDPEIYQYSEELNHPMPVEERSCMRTVWRAKWKEMTGDVQAPVMFALAEHDGWWKGTAEHVQEFAAGFANSERVDGSLIIGAPHNLEMSYWAAGWYARCFGFALECAATFAQKR